MSTRARPHRDPVAGSPFQPGARVRVVRAVDPGVHDVSGFVGAEGSVEYLEYNCGCSQTFPSDPMVGVSFTSGGAEEFWPEELQEIAP